MRLLNIKENDVELFRFLDSDGVKRFSNGNYGIDLVDSLELYHLLNVIEDDYSFLELHVDLNTRLLILCTYCGNFDDNEDIVIKGIGAKKLLEKAKDFINKSI